MFPDRIRENAAISSLGHNGRHVFNDRRLFCRMEGKLVVSVQGTIDTCSTTRASDVYCKYGFSMEGDWEQCLGTSAGISPTAHMTGANPAVFNHPFQITMSSSSPFGWPQLVLAVYGNNRFGNDMVVGYGATHVPTDPGEHEIEVPLFAPKPGSIFQKIAAFFTGLYPELIDSNMVASGKERECLQTASQGFVKVTMNVVVSDTEPLELNL